MRGYCSRQTSAQPISANLQRLYSCGFRNIETQNPRKGVFETGEGLLGRLFNGESIREVQKPGCGGNYNGRREKTIRKAKGCLFIGVGVVVGNRTKVS